MNYYFNKEVKKKVTYPLLWTNTVCSHPLNIESENKFYNIKNAVIKRVKYEIGLKTNQNLYNLFTRIIYRDDNDKKFEEYELDYIFLGKINDKKFNINNLKKLINKDEIENIKFKNINWILNDIKQNSFKYTPWFKLLLNKKGVEIDNIVNNDNLYKYKYNGEIINFI
jgi:isopentenyl-diphosphate delta-isomerase